MNNVLTLEGIKWSEFQLSKILSIESSNNSIDEVKLVRAETELTPYVTRSNNLNGIKRFVAEQPTNINLGNVITIGLDTQTIFYQPAPFYTGQNIQIITYDGINRFNALFILRALEVTIKKFSWGSYGATLSRLRASKVLLPSKGGHPDWLFMEAYAKHVEKRLLLQSISHFDNQIAKSDTSSAGVQHWGEVRLEDTFEHIQRGKRLIKSKQHEGDIPYISSTGMTNGVDNFIGNANTVRRFEGGITIANSGSVGAVFYHPYPFIASDHVTVLTSKHATSNSYLFLANAMSKLGEKYAFNREMSDKRIRREKIMLPLDSNNKPDWGYMDSYAEGRKISKVHAWLDYAKKITT